MILRSGVESRVMPGARLTTTSYALLALLAVRSWTTYELAQQMDRSMRWYWPRAASVVYEEPKRLVGRGLATARQEYTGRRPRTVYAITEDGWAALRHWFDEPAAGPVMEFEGLLKVAFSNLGDRSQLLATLRAIVEDAERRHRAALAQAADYLDTGGPYPDRLPVIALSAKLLLEHTELVLRWARWAEQEVQSWSGVTPQTGAAVPGDAFSLGW